VVTQAAMRHAEHIRQIGLLVPAGAATRGNLGHIFARQGTTSAPRFGIPLTERLHPLSTRGPLASHAVGQNPARSCRSRRPIQDLDGHVKEPIARLEVDVAGPSPTEPAEQKTEHSPY
jgi:hypothetical protein